MTSPPDQLTTGHYRSGSGPHRLGTVLPGLVLITSLIAAGSSLAAPPQTSVAEDVPRTAKPFANQPENFQFVVVGDRTGGHRPGIFRSAIERINQLQPEFVVGVGDLVEGYKEDSRELNAEWDEFDAIVNQLDMPFFYTVGNHDISNETMRQLWLKRNGSDYYHFLYQGVLFISLNTEDPPVQLDEETLQGQRRLESMMRDDPEGTQKMILERAAERSPEQALLPGEVAISDEQVQWVSRVLKHNPDVRWTIVLMHKPAWEYKHPGFEKIETMLAERPHTVIAGHEHYYNYSRRGNADYITMATTGGVWLKPGGGAFDHIAWVTMTQDGPIISNILVCGLMGTAPQIASSMKVAGGNPCSGPMH